LGRPSRINSRCAVKKDLLARKMLNSRLVGLGLVLLAGEVRDYQSVTTGAKNARLGI
jgi:hypothetical protein